MTEEKQAERKPLMNKLEPSGTRTHNAFHHEAQEWSKTGRGLVQFLQEVFWWIFGD